jgi:geranylgeranyl diphosphate synthase, type II
MTQGGFRRRYESIRRRTDRRLLQVRPAPGAAHLRDGCRYVLDGGGKRVRSVLLILSCEAVGGTAARALHAAAAIEILHNFTLVHDDIMDNAVARRGRPAVHRKWNVNEALLVGDALVGAAYEALLRTTGSTHGKLGAVLTQGLLDVCEGQSLDLEFEARTDVSVKEYFRMTGMKTGALIAAAAELGGLVGGGRRSQVRALRRFGLLLGKAFQVQDDLLDVVGDPHDFGKTIGGDILEGKKTYLLLRAAERAKGEDRTLLGQVLRKEGSAGGWKNAEGAVTPPGLAVVEAVKDFYMRCGVIDEARVVVKRTTDEALAQLGRLPRSDARDMLRWLAEELVRRES